MDNTNNENTNDEQEVKINDRMKYQEHVLRGYERSWEKIIFWQVEIMTT